MRHAEDFGQKSRHRPRESLKRRTRRQNAVRSRSADHDKRNDTQHHLYTHGAVADQTHVFFTRNHLGAGTGTHQRVKARNGAAGNCHEKNREKIKPFDGESGKSRHVERRILNAYADYGRDNHADQKKHRQIVTRLLQKPHRHDGSGKEVGKHHVAPRHGVGVNREIDARCHHDDHEHDAHAKLHAGARLTVLEIQPEADSHEHIEQRNRGSSRIGHDLRAVFGKTVEGVGHHVTESCDHQKREEPAEKQEELTARAAHVGFNNHADGLAAVFDGRVKRREVLDGPEEDTADNHPQQRGRPAEHRRNDGTGHGTGTRN